MERDRSEWNNAKADTNATDRAPMRLGLSSYAYYWALRIQPRWMAEGLPMTPRSLLAKTAELGLEVLQVCENAPLTNWCQDELQGFREAARGLGVALEVGARGLDLDYLRKNMAIAHSLDARILRISPWSGSESRSQAALEPLARVVGELLPLCVEYEITLAIENYFDIPDRDLAGLMRQVNDPHVGVCLDTANSAGSLEKPLDTAETLAPYVVSVHLKDFIVAKPTMGYVISGVPLGHGWVDTQRILELLRQAGRSPNVLLELWVDSCGSDEDTLRREDEWVRQSITFARQQLGGHLKSRQDTSQNREGR